MEKHRDRLSRGLFRRAQQPSSNKQNEQTTSARQHRPGGAGDSKSVRECACGRGLACTGMTQAFKLLGDPRSLYVELPRFKENPPAYKYVFRNNLRAAYLRHLKQTSPTLDTSGFDSTHRHYVALHHFHPTVVKAFHENPLTSAQKHKVPISITEHELRDLNMQICEEDRILSVTGVATGGYYFVPGYPHDRAHEDLKNLIRTERETREAKRGAKVAPQPVPVAAQKSPILNSAPTTSPQISIDQLEARRAAVQRTVRPAAEAATVEKAAPSPPLRSPDSKDDNEDGAAPVAQSPVEPTKPADVDEPETVQNPVQPAKPADVDEPETAQSPAEPANDEKDTVAQTPDEPTSQEKDTAVQTPDESSKHDEVAAEEQSPVQATKHDDETTAQSPARADQDDDGDKSDDSGDDDKTGDDNHDSDDDNNDDGSEDPLTGGPSNEDGEFDTLVADSTASEFDSLWAEETNEDDIRPTKPTTDANSSLSDLDKSTPVILESDNEDHEPSEHFAETSSKPQTEDTIASLPNSKTPTRQVDHPWDTPKYRRNTSRPEISKIRSSGPATFIDPSVVTLSADDQDSQKAEDSTATAERVQEEATKPLPSGDEHKVSSEEEPDVVVPVPNLKSNEPGVLSVQTDLSIDPPGKHAEADKKRTLSPTRSVDSDDSIGTSTAPISLRHPLPGTDPTMRIQVHNELIAWESKRRSSRAVTLETNREEWKVARDILRSGVEEVEYAERLVLGFAKAGIAFADALQAIHDDKLLDDAGNTVSSSFVQNRLQKQRQVQEYSIDKSQAETVGEGESALLNSLIKSQVELANTLRESSQHMEEEILVEITELRSSIQSRAREIEIVGDGILGELKRSEIEVKNIWDVFDAMVTGDLMEYSTHGSMHGSFHGSYGSQHGGSLHTPLSHSSSVHGFSADSSSPIISSLNSPLVKSTFRQLGNVEDGWLIETHYKTAVTYQKSVFDMAEQELETLFAKITSLERERFQKLHQVMLAFVPRQARLYTALPKQLKDVLDDLVGLRIDEESLQAAIDQSIKDRSHNHMKLASTHRSSIMNRSRIKSMADTPEDEIQDIEELFGNSFDSSMILVSKILELKPGGLGGMVNASWKVVLALVTSDGNFHLFELPSAINWNEKTPAEAFRALYPPMKFDSQAAWVVERKDPIVRSLTPTVSLNLRICGFTISNIRKRQFDVVEDRGNQKVQIGARLLKAVNAGALRQTKCTLRLPSPSDTSEWVALLEKTKKDVGSKTAPERRTSRFRF